MSPPPQVEMYATYIMKKRYINRIKIIIHLVFLLFRLCIVQYSTPELDLLSIIYLFVQDVRNEHRQVNIKYVNSRQHHKSAAVNIRSFNDENRIREDGFLLHLYVDEWMQDLKQKAQGVGERFLVT